ncbi:hypothetical protein [Methanoregula sp.]|uniref:hypothetical protein n=1 Tax=Methanoregula sp. TaxID=2052170 RepID=UPI0035676F2D
MVRPVTLCAALVFLVIIVFWAGCTSPAPAGEQSGALNPPAEPVNSVRVSQTPVHAVSPGVTEQLALVNSSSSVWREAYRIFSNMKSTEYVHTTYVNESKGIYRFDCLGFVDYVLQQGAPEAFKSAGHGYERPELAVYGRYFRNLGPTPNPEGWSRVARPVDLKPGDICLWQKITPDSVGHMWIIAGTPYVNPARTDEVLVRIFDSDGVHADDSRAAKSYKYGLGSGILGMLVDAGGNPVGLNWQGGNMSSPGTMDPTIVCARYNK